MFPSISLRKMLFCGFLAASLFSEAMDNPQARQKSQKASQKTTPLVIYYTKQHLAQLYADKIQPHCIYALLIEFEEQNFEAMSQTLFDGIKGEGYPIIVTSALLKGLLQFLHTSQSGEKTDIVTAYSKIPNIINASFTKEKWNIYSNKKGNLILLNPKKFSSAFLGTSFAFDQVKDISNLLPTQDQAKEKNAFLQLEKALTTEEKKSIKAEELKEFFYTKKDTEKLLPIWDIVITGHGNLPYSLPTGLGGDRPIPPLIAGLSPQSINDILAVFDNYVDTGVVYIESCYSGGINLNFLQTREGGLTISHNFILIIGATTDSPTQRSYGNSYFKYFNTAAELSDYGSALNTLVASITKLSFPRYYEKDNYSRIHGTEKIPQVWLPNGIGFQTFELDTFIYSIGNVKAKIAQENKQPLVVENKQVILVYPPIIEAPLIVSATPQKNWLKNPEKVEDVKEKTWPQMPMLSEKIFWENPSKEKISLLIPNKNKIIEELVKSYPSLAQMPDESQDSFLFPQILSMQKKQHICIFKQIKIASTIPTFGLLRFIRDSFLDITGRTIQQAFYIEELVGYNDISLLLEADRKKSPFKQLKFNKLGEDYLQDKKDKQISLYNVSIITQHNPIMRKDIFFITFNLEDGSAWALSSQRLNNFPGTINWNSFYLISPEYPKKMLDEARLKIGLSPRQTLMSQTLKEKQLDIAKQPFIKKAEAAEIPRAQQLKLTHEDAINHALQAIANKDLIYFRNALASGVDLGNQHDVQLLKKVINQMDIPNKSAYLEALLGKSKGQ